MCYWTATFNPFIPTALFDYLPPPMAAVLIFQEKNKDELLCKQITIVDDGVPDQMLVEEFRVQLAVVEAVGIAPADVQFNPVDTIVKITDDDINVPSKCFIWVYLSRPIEIANDGIEIPSMSSIIDRYSQHLHRSALLIVTVA